MGDKNAVKVLTNLTSELKDAGFIVLLDTQRPPFSEEWRRHRYLCIQQCHGAIMLFSESALKSEWIEYEAKMLNARKYLNPRLVVIPLLMPSVGQDQLAKYRFSISILDVSRQVREDSSFTPIVEHFASFKNVPPENPLQKLAAVIAPWLNKLDWTIIERIAQEELHTNISNWPEDIESCKILLAQELLKAKHPDIPNAMSELLSKLEQKHAEHIVTILSPSWIDERAVAPISKIVSRPVVRRTMCLNSEEPLTGHMYIRHACNGSPKPSSDWPTIEVLTTSGEDQFEALERQILESFREKLVAKSNTYIKNLLRLPRIGNNSYNNPYIVLIRGDLGHNLEREALTRLRTEYGNVTFFLLSSDKSIDEQTLEENNIELLRPLLDHQQEWDALKVCQDIDWFVKSWFY